MQEYFHYIVLNKYERLTGLQWNGQRVRSYLGGVPHLNCELALNRPISQKNIQAMRLSQ